MNVVKKAVKAAAVLLAAVLLFAEITFLFFKPLYYRIYPFDRITGTIRVTVDGEAYLPDAGDVTGSYEGEEVEIGFRKNADGADVSIHGGEYGPYLLTIRVDGLDAPLEAVIYQSNWWNVASFALEISIDRAAETVTLSSSAQVVNAGSSQPAERHTTTAAFSEKRCVHSIVSV